MNKQQQSPWASGPGEILKHGIKLLEQDSDVNRRLAMISIDNAVELMIKTYLGLPTRITGLSLSRKEYQEFSQNFNDLLDALEKYATDKLESINLGEIEWYHRIRNELYHQGNGLTVEKDKVEVYAQLANLLFKNLFGFPLVKPDSKHTELLGEFIEAWLKLEEALFGLAQDHSLTGFQKRSVIEVLKYLYQGNIIAKNDMDRIEYFRRIRNDVVYGIANLKEVLSRQLITEMQALATLYTEKG